MTTRYAIKILSKYAKVEKNPNTNMYFADKLNEKEGGVYRISFHDQAGTAICLHVQNTHDEADPQSDYFPGSYWDTMAQALRYGWGIETRKERMGAIQ